MANEQTFADMNELAATCWTAGPGEKIEISPEEYQRLIRKQEWQRLIDALARARDGETDWDALSYGMGRNELPGLLSYVWWRLRDGHLIAALSHAWVSAEFPEHQIPRKEWLPIFRAAGYHQKGIPWTPPDRVTLYRGGVKKTRMSWTADREKAEWFQHRFDAIKPGKLWAVTVNANRLLAHYGEDYRKEDEYVIDPTGLQPKQIHGDAQ